MHVICITHARNMHMPCIYHACSMHGTSMIQVATETICSHCLNAQYNTLQYVCDIIASYIVQVIPYIVGTSEHVNIQAKYTVRKPLCTQIKTKDSHASCDLSLVHCHQPYRRTHSKSQAKQDETAAQLRSNRFFSN